MEFKSNFSLKREISDTIRMAMVMMSGVYQQKHKQPKFVENAAEDSLYIKLIKMVDEGALGEAENCLWERMEQGQTEDFQLALDIYSYMNDKDEDFLEEHDFSREEIRDGVQHVMSQGISPIM
ncbi:MAG: hypothetical protein J1E62_05795 [Lachnospiraceae bacterium]|nr:hypothetical protein [Lachnospiraceae bacterium]